jgi:hypothetical protein
MGTSLGWTHLGQGCPSGALAGKAETVAVGYMRAMETELGTGRTRVVRLTQVGLKKRTTRSPVPSQVPLAVKLNWDIAHSAFKSEGHRPGSSEERNPGLFRSADCTRLEETQDAAALMIVDAFAT